MQSSSLSGRLGRGSADVCLHVGAFSHPNIPTNAHHRWASNFFSVFAAMVSCLRLDLWSMCPSGTSTNNKYYMLFPNSTPPLPTSWLTALLASSRGVPWDADWSMCFPLFTATNDQQSMQPRITGHLEQISFYAAADVPASLYTSSVAPLRPLSPKALPSTRLSQATSVMC